jgi:ribosome-binding factor A
METQRKERLEGMMIRGINNYISKEANRSTLITVTRVILDDHARSAKVLFTVFPADFEDKAKLFLERHAVDIQKHLKQSIRKHYMPFIKFDIDSGEKNRQNIDKLLKEDSNT